VDRLAAARARRRAEPGASTVLGVDAVSCSCSQRPSAAAVWLNMLVDATRAGAGAGAARALPASTPPAFARPSAAAAALRPPVP